MVGAQEQADADGGGLASDCGLLNTTVAGVTYDGEALVLGTHWQPGDPKYSAAMLAGNFRAIRKQISDLLSTGGRDVIVSMQQVGAP